MITWDSEAHSKLFEKDNQAISATEAIETSYMFLKIPKIKCKNLK